MHTSGSALKAVQRMVFAALAILLVAEVAWLLKGLVSYMVIVIFALLLFAVHWLTRHNKKVSKWRKYLALTMPVITIVGPIVYIVYLLMSDTPSFWVHLAMMAGFILPLLLMMLAIYRLQKLINQQSPPQ